MSASSLEAILLTTEQKAILHEIEHEEEVDPTIARRARIILELALPGASNAEVARKTGASSSTVATWRNRWLQDQRCFDGARGARQSQSELREQIVTLLSNRSRSEEEAVEIQMFESVGRHRNGSQAIADDASASEQILQELAQLRQKLEEVQQENQDLNVILETLTEHSDTLSEELQQENEDLAFMLEMTTEHSDTVSEELHQKAEDALRESERRLRLIVQATPVPVIISRISDREIQYANHMAGSLLELKNEDVIGYRLTDFFQHPSDWKGLIERIATDESVDEHELELITSKDTQKWASVSMRSLEFDDNASVLAAFHDVTDRKRAEMRLKQQVDELKLELDEARLSSQAAEESGTAFFSNLDAASEQKTNVRLFAIHSFHGGTGKSSIIANVAALLAASGKRVGMIDTDLQAPGLHVLFGRAGKKHDNTLNDLLAGTCTASQAAIDVTAHIGPSVTGKLFLIPASTNPGHIAQILSQGYEASRLSAAIRQFSDALQLDVLLIDTHPGLNEEALLSMELADAVVLTLCPDQQDFEGTGIAVQVARKLKVSNLMLMVNRVPESYNLAELQRRVESTYGCSVVGVMPHSNEALTFHGNGMFALCYPGHPMTAGFKQIARSLMSVNIEPSPQS